jgi:predicted nucleotide-binding protein
MPANKELLESLRDQFEQLRFQNKDAQMQLRDEGLMVIRRTFGHDHEYLDTFKRIGFYPEFYPATYEDERAYWENGKSRASSLFRTMIRELELDETATGHQSGQEVAPVSNRVFVVHGHDNEMKQAVARTVERLGLEAVILHERPNRGQTLIEKIERFSDVGFAVVLLSPDDTGYATAAGPDAAKPRARQNVILELGYFAGKLGRERVVALHRGSIEFPSDYDGVLYTPYDGDSGAWRNELVAELRESGYDVSADNL